MTFGRTTPVFRIFDEAKAKEFYLGYLGFNLVFEHRFENNLPLYMSVSKGDCVIHLSEHHGDCCPGAAVRISTDDVESFHRELTEESYAYSQPEVQEMPWGSRDMTVTDPFGNRLTFTTDTAQ